MSFNSIRDAPCVQWLLSFAKWLADNARPFVVPDHALTEIDFASKWLRSPCRCCSFTEMQTCRRRSV
jgi:hypothetical protein